MNIYKYIYIYNYTYIYISYIYICIHIYIYIYIHAPLSGMSRTTRCAEDSQSQQDIHQGLNLWEIPYRCL